MYQPTKSFSRADPDRWLSTEPSGLSEAERWQWIEIASHPDEVRFIDYVDVKTLREWLALIDFPPTPLALDGG